MAAPRNRIGTTDSRVRGLGAPTPDDIAAHHERVHAHQKAVEPAPKVPFDQVLLAQAQAVARPQASEAAQEGSSAPTDAGAKEKKPLPPWRSRRIMRG